MKADQGRTNNDDGEVAQRIWWQPRWLSFSLSICSRWYSAYELCGLDLFDSIQGQEIRSIGNGACSSGSIPSIPKDTFDAVISLRAATLDMTRREIRSYASWAGRSVHRILGWMGLPNRIVPLTLSTLRVANQTPSSLPKTKKYRKHEFARDQISLSRSLTHFHYKGLGNGGGREGFGDGKHIFFRRERSQANSYILATV